MPDSVHRCLLSPGAIDGGIPARSGFLLPAAMAEDLREFMDVHGIDEAFLLGHSDGGKTVMQFAGMYPKRAGALVVVDIARAGIHRGMKRYSMH